MSRFLPGLWLYRFAPLVAALPFLVLAIRVVAASRDPVYSGDAGLLALAVHDAAHADRALGPYSQFGFFHPGPALFYLLSPFEWVTGFAPWAIPFGVEILNAVAAAWIVWMARDIRPTHRPPDELGLRPEAWPVATLAATVAIAYSVCVGIGLLQIFWNPLQIMLPCALVLVSVGMINGWGWPAASALLAGTFTIQTNLTTAPMMLAALGCGSVLLGVDVVRSIRRSAVTREPNSQTRRFRITRSSAGPVALTALAGVVWLPPLVQQLMVSPGNVGKLVSFLRKPNPAHTTWSEAAGYLGRQISVIPHGVHDFGAMDGSHALRGQLVLLAFIVLAAALIILGTVWGSKPLQRLGIVSVVGVAAALISVVTIRGTVWWYYTAWMSCLSVPLLIGWGVVVSRVLPATSRAIAVLGIAALAVAGIWSGATTTVDDSAAFPNEPGYRTNTTEVWHLISASLRRRPRGTLVLGGDAGLTPTMAGVALKLEAQGIDVRVPVALVPPFGPEEQAGRRARPYILLTTGMPGSGYRVLGIAPSHVAGMPSATVSVLEG